MLAHPDELGRAGAHRNAWVPTGNLGAGFRAIWALAGALLKVVRVAGPAADAGRPT